MLVVSFVFLGVLIFEAIVLAVHYEVETFEFKIFFLLLLLITGAAMAVFVVEGLLQRKRLQKKSETEQAQNST
jgi:ABC-type antimicrobial peptide transport system permease subunit